MADWQRKLVLTEAFEAYKAQELTVQEVSKIVVEKLKELLDFDDPYIDFCKQDILEDFETLSEDEEANEDEFNWWMESLYNWGDISLDGKFGGKKVCWIQTF